MKFYLVIYILSSAILLTLSQGCKKSHPPSPAVKPIEKFSKHPLAYVGLSVGKYLIYKDSATLALDSVIVTTSNLTFLDNPGGAFDPAYSREIFNLVLTKFTGVSQTEWFNGTAVADLNSYMSSDTLSLALLENGGLAFFLSESDQPNYSITIEGKTYLNVVVSDSDDGLAITDPNYRRAIYYWAKGIGIIKRSITTGSSVQTYTLLRNN